MIKLIASDMDGTLLNDHDKINEEFFHILNEISKKNILFTVASGRQYYNLLNKFYKAKDDIVYIAENGSYVIYQGRELFSSVLDKTMVKFLVRLGRKIEDCGIIICGKEFAYVEENYEKFIKEVEKYYLKYKIVDSLDYVSEDILKVTLCDFKGALENSFKIFSDTYGGKLQITVSGRYWIDIINKTVNKGVAIKLLQEKFNIKPEETMVFGDYFNDIEMFHSAYYSYAMENAPEDVKKHARFIAKRNVDNGVLEIIKENIL